MGYTTDFNGSFSLNKKLDEETFLFLKRFNETRRMSFNVGSEFGVEGEFFVGHHEDFSGQFAGQVDRNDSRFKVLDYNRPPSTQPSLWCQWVPTEDGMGITWDGGEKFYSYVEWLNYIITNFLAPKGYVLNGEVQWEGEDRDDSGTIYVANNKVTAVDDGDELERLRAENAELKAQLADKTINTVIKG